MRSRITHTLGEALLTLLALGGLICLVLVALALFFNMSLMMFKTGSMSPTIPAGSVALVREIPASEVVAGDIVTVDREHALPVTHRVTSVAQGSHAEERVITMRGDANRDEDPEPYRVETVRIVVGSVPALAHVIVWFGHPVVLGTITLGASALVTWAFWPRVVRDPEDLPRHSGRRAHAALAALAVASVGVGVVTAPEPAWAAEQVTHGSYLTLVSITNPSMLNLEPNGTATWQVGVTVAPPEPGEVTLSLSGVGDDTLGLIADIDACSTRWVAGLCSGEVWPLTSGEPLHIDGVERDILTMPSDEQRWLLFTVGMPASATPDPGDRVTQRVHASGFGESIAIDPLSVAHTGADHRWLLALAVLGVGGGLTTALLARLVPRRVRPS